MIRRLPCLVAAGALALVALPAAPALAATSSITVQGTVLRDDGRPLSGATVRLTYTPGFFDTLAAVTSLGTFCLVSDICDSADLRTKTDAKGHWRVRLVKSGHLASAGKVHLSATLPDGTATSTVVSFGQKSRTLPALHLWKAGLRTSHAPDHQLVPDWTELPDGDGAEAHYAVSAEDRHAATTMTQDDLLGGDPIDDRLLQSGDTRLVVTATATDDRYGKVTYRAKPLPLAGLATPLSRHRTAKRVMANGRFSPPLPRWTDGDLGTEVDDTKAQIGDKGIQIDLGALTTVSAVTLDECTFECTVTTSPDGRTWTTFGSLDSGHPSDVVVTGDPVRARYVRWSSDFSIDYSDGRELSVW